MAAVSGSLLTRSLVDQEIDRTMDAKSSNRSIHVRRWLDDSGATRRALKADVGLLLNIIAKADVFIQNFAPGAASRLGLGANERFRPAEELISIALQSRAVSQIRRSKLETDHAQSRLHA
jgi:CoA transferase family III